MATVLTNTWKKMLRIFKSVQQKQFIVAVPCLFETSDLSTFSNALSAITYSSSVYASTVTRCF